MENDWVRYLKSQYVEGQMEVEDFEEQLDDALAYDEAEEMTVMPAEVWEWRRTNRRVTDAPGAIIHLDNADAVLREIYAVEQPARRAGPSAYMPGCASSYE